MEMSLRSSPVVLTAPEITAVETVTNTGKSKSDQAEKLLFRHTMRTYVRRERPCKGVDDQDELLNRWS